MVARERKPDLEGHAARLSAEGVALVVLYCCCCCC